MPDSLHSGAPLARSYALARGPRVRLRLAQTQDAPAIRELLARHGRAAETLDVARLVHFDPRRRVVICAAALVGTSATIAGVGAIELGAREPDVLVVDDELTEGLDQLLRQALVERAGVVRRSAA